MSKKHYIEIAQLLDATRARAYCEGKDAVDEVAGGLADIFEKDNPNFDRVRFLEACGAEFAE